MMKINSRKHSSLQRVETQLNRLITQKPESTVTGDGIKPWMKRWNLRSRTTSGLQSHFLRIKGSLGTGGFTSIRWGYLELKKIASRSDLLRRVMPKGKELIIRKSLLQ